MNRAIAVVWVLVAGCVSPSAVECGDGITCAPGTACVAAAAGSDTLHLCVDPDQVTCALDGDGTACVWEEAAGTCHGGACIPDACGNLLLDSTELCDDGNNEAGDGCAADCASNEACGNGQPDAIGGEQCDDGNNVNHDGCSSRCIIESAVWQPFDAMPARLSSAMAYDTRRHRAIVFGGQGPADVLADTRTWDGRQWHVLATPVAPLARYGHAMTYDAARGQIVMFGAKRDTWTFDDAGWTPRYPAHTPSARRNAVLVYDAKRERVVLYAGTDVNTDGEPITDMWSWDGTDWTQENVTVPPGRVGAAAAFDPKRGVVVMFGGSNNSVFGLAETWELDGTTWTQKAMTGTVPGARRDAVMVWNPLTQKIMLIGGVYSSTYMKDTWEWDGSTWTPGPAVPSAIGNAFSRHVAATDTARNRIVLLGTSNDTWELDGTTWRAVVDNATASNPTARYRHVAMHDPRRDHIVIFGGVMPGGTVFDSWLFDGVWKSFGATTHPSARFAAAMAYDPIRDEGILFGGCAPGFVGSNETWAYRYRNGVPSWTLLSPAVSPPAVCQHTLAWDGTRGRIMAFGGITAAGMSGETWSWNGQTWALDAASGPDARVEAVMGWDPGADRVVLYGGGNGDGEIYYNDTWAWNGTSWTQLAAPNGPSQRGNAALAWDPRRQRLVLFGGQGGFAGYFDDAYELAGNDWQLVPQQQAPGAQRNHALVSTLDGGVIMIGGEEGVATLGPPLRLRWDAPGGGDETCTSIDIDGDELVGCADPDCDPYCEPLCALDEPTCSSGPRCGDGACDPYLESCDLCAADCGECATSCGDGTCGNGETAASCPGDC